MGETFRDSLTDWLIEWSEHMKEGRDSDLSRLEIITLKMFASWLDENYKPPYGLRPDEPNRTD